MSSATGVTASWKVICLGVGCPEPAMADTASRQEPDAAESPPRIALPRRRPIMRIAPKIPGPALTRKLPAGARARLPQDRLHVLLATSPVVPNTSASCRPNPAVGTPLRSTKHEPEQGLKGAS